MLQGEKKKKRKENNWGKAKAFVSGKKKQVYFSADVLWENRTQNNNNCRLETGLNQTIFVCECVCRINYFKGNSLNQFLVSMGTQFEMKKTHFACYLCL